MCIIQKVFATKILLYGKFSRFVTLRKTSCYFQINISGVYHLESHDSGYADYLLAMDILKAAVPHILAA